MAFRGRGGGRGGFGRGYSKEEPFVPFPDIKLPDPKIFLSELDQKRNKGLKEEETLIIDTLNWLVKSEYNLDKSDRQDKESEKSERANRKAKRSIDSFSQYLVPSMFPKELTRGSNVRQVSREHVKWDKQNTEKSEIFWNHFEKREQLDAKKKKVGENEEEEDEDEDVEAEEEESDPSDDDYQKNIDFDDDEDDFNLDDGDDEPILDA